MSMGLSADDGTVRDFTVYSSCYVLAKRLCLKKSDRLPAKWLQDVKCLFKKQDSSLSSNFKTKMSLKCH